MEDYRMEDYRIPVTTMFIKAENKWVANIGDTYAQGDTEGEAKCNLLRALVAVREQIQKDIQKTNL